MAARNCFSQRWRPRWVKRIFALVAAGLVFANMSMKTSSSSETDPAGLSKRNQWSMGSPSRKLLSTVEWEKCDFELGFARNYSAPVSSWHTPGITYAWIALYVFLTLCIFVALAIVCDDFFVPSLEVISERLELSEDVAGATFMAAGSSAPELFTSIAGVTVESDVGVGTIVGSAVFNLLGIVALSAAFAGKTLNLDWRPLARDSTFYALSIALFIIFAWDGKFMLYESIIMLSLYILYIAIMKVNFKLMELLAKISCIELPGSVPVDETANRKAPVHPTHTEGRDTALNFGQNDRANAEEFTNCSSMSPARRSIPAESNQNHVEFRSDYASPLESRRFSHVHRGELTHTIIGIHDSIGRRSSLMSESAENRRTNSLLRSQTSIDIKEKENFEQSCSRSTDPIANGSLSLQDDTKETGVSETQKVEAKEEKVEEGITVCSCLPPIKTEVPAREEEDKGCLSNIKIVLHWMLFLVSFPFVVGFSWTIPNCAKPNLQKYFIVSFLMSVLWIAALSFAMVTVVGRAGCILGVDKFTMGLVVVAIGTSVPDALSSILVARDGYGDMAVSNAIGSNVFDIDLGLGLPFVISILIRKMKPVLLLNKIQQAKFDSGKMKIIPHVKFGFLLLFILLLAIVTFAIARFKLTKKLGVCFVILYVCFVTYAYVQDIYCDHKC